MSRAAKESGEARPAPGKTDWSALLKATCVGGLGVLAVAISRSGEALHHTGKALKLSDGPSGVRAKERARPLPPTLLNDKPPCRLKRPLLFVPGFQTPKDRFDHLTEKLTEGGLNGGKVYFVQGDRVYSDKDCRHEVRHPDGEARVFVAVFHSSKDSPPVAASELDRTLARISKLTGEKVDVAAYSMGGLATRCYLDRGGQDVGKFMMVGTPNHGSPLAEVSLGGLNLEAQGRGVGWLLANGPKALDQDDRSALSWLITEQDGNNPGLEHLNSNWSRQRSKVEEVLIVGSGERSTFGFNFKPTRGDATVPVESLPIDNSTPVVLLDDKSRGTHGLLFSNPNLYDTMSDFFKWERVV